MRLKYFAGGVLKLKGGKEVARKLLRIGERRVFYPCFGGDVSLDVTTPPPPPGEQERSSKSTDSVADVGVW